MPVGLQDVSARYGHPVVVLNLVKSAEKRPRETILRKEFAIAIAYINEQVHNTFYGISALPEQVTCCSIVSCWVQM